MKPRTGRRPILAPEAVGDLREICNYISRDNPGAADRMLTRFYEEFYRISCYPDAGHERRDLATDRPLLFWPVGRYLVVYRKKKSRMEIVAVLHGSRGIPAVLREREEGE